MSRFLALIMVAAMALFISASGGPAMAQTTDGTTDGTSTTTTDGGVTTTGEVTVSGDVIFQDTDVSVADEEVVNNLFSLDGSGTTRWTIEGSGIMNIAQWFQSGTFNSTEISQNPDGAPYDQMNVTHAYQFGNLNTAKIDQHPGTSPGSFWSNFSIGSQIGETNTVKVGQNSPVSSP